MASGSTKAILAALFANMAIAIAKFIGYLVTASSSMLAESIHSVADTSNQALLLWGNNRAKKHATAEHPFGYGRERYFWSFIVALVLFSLGGLFAIYEGVHKLGETSHELKNVGWAIGILVLGIFLEGYSFRTAVVESRLIKGRSTWWEFIRHSRTPELPVVLLEDLGALTGLVLALLGVSLSKITGNSRWDAYATIAIGALLVLIAAVLVYEMKSLLIGESARAPMRSKIVSAIEGGEGVLALLDLRTQHIGPDQLLVAAEVKMDPHLDTAGVATAIDAVEARIRQAVPIAKMIYLEPDIPEQHIAQAGDDATNR
jgi:cation diffusion facilitator family transporter